MKQRLSAEERARRNVEANRRWRQANRERVRAYSRARYAADPERQMRYAREHDARHRDRARARSLVGKRIQRGQMVRPDHCEACGISCKPDAHHADYSKPLDVRFLCESCHKEADKIRDAAAEDGRRREVKAAAESKAPRAA